MRHASTDGNARTFVDIAASLLAVAVAPVFPLLSLLGCGDAPANPASSPDTPLDAGSEAAPDAGSPPAPDAGEEPDARTDGSASSHVKWNPGHYGLTYGPILRYGQAINTSELDTLGGKSAIVGYKSLLYWAALDLGAVTFTASVGGATSGALTSTSTSGGGGAGEALTNGTYWFSFADGSYRKVTLSGTSSSWSGALAAGSITTAYVYQFSQIDEHLSYLRTKLDVPRHYALTVLPGTFTSPGLSSDVIPNYILTDPAMGPSPTPGSYGWWGGKGNGNTATAALHRSAVNERWIALVKALGAYFDSEPYFEAFVVQEDSWEEGALSTNGCPDYSNHAYVENLESFLSAAVGAFPHTNVVQQNSWVGVATDAQELAEWMTKNRVAPGNADTWGQSYIKAKGIAEGLPWGVAAYAGVVSPGSTWPTPYDMRPVIRYMPDVEAPDMGLFGGIGGGPFTPADLVAALDQTLGASHVFWSIIPDKTTGILPPNDGGQVWWTNLCAFLASHPLTSTGYPSAYP
jgi:hypothetical protein